MLFTYSLKCVQTYVPLSFRHSFKVLPCSSDSKESACNAGGLGLIPGLGRPAGDMSLYRWGGLTELTQGKSHNPCLAPRQRLNKHELSVMAATLFQQDHTEWLFIPESTLTFLPHLPPKAVLKVLFLTYLKERTLSVSVSTA